MALLGLRCVCSVVVVIVVVVVVVVGVSRGRPVCVLMAQTFFSMIEWLLSHAALGLVVLHCVGGVGGVARRASTMRAAAARLAPSFVLSLVFLQLLVSSSFFAIFTFFKVFVF